MKFKVTKVLDQGTDNPIVNRIFLQFSEMINNGFFWIEEEKQTQFRGLLYKLMEELLKIEQTVNDYIKIEDDSIARIKLHNGIKFQRNGFSYDDPTIQLCEKFENFLIKSVVSLRKFTKVCSYILNRNFNSHRDLYNFLCNFIIENLGKENSLYKWIEKQNSPIKDIYDLRGLVEHEELKIDKFNVEIDGNNIKVIKPRISNTDFTLRVYMQGALKFLFNYYEHMIAQLLATIYRGYGGIVALDNDEMSKNRNFKYKIDFSAK